MATFGENLKRLRERAGLAQASELAERLAVTRPVVSKWENDRGGLPEGPTLLRIAKALNCSVEELLEGVDQDYDEQRRVSRVTEVLESDADRVDVDPTVYKKGALPVLGEGDGSPQGRFFDDAGTPLAQVTEWMSRPYDLRDPNAYVIVLKGDSMEPYLKRGYRLIISPNVPVADGELGYVYLESGERLVKQVRRTDGGYILESYNPAYAPRYVDRAHVLAVHRVAYIRTLR